jgi:hypothetical protein
MSAPEIPTNYTITSTATLAGALDLDLDNIHIKELAPITLTPITITPVTLTTHSDLDMGLDDIRIKELPRIDLHVETAIKPTRVHFPVNLRFGLCTFGVELLAFCICGESMVVVEDYVPHKTEVCT